MVVRLRKSRHANICSKNQFFRENVVVIGFSELRPGSNERYENFTFYGPFRFLTASQLIAAAVLGEPFCRLQKICSINGLFIDRFF